MQRLSFFHYEAFSNSLILLLNKRSYLKWSYDTYWKTVVKTITKRQVNLLFMLYYVLLKTFLNISLGIAESECLKLQQSL